MLAYTSRDGQIVEIQVDVAPDGVTPLLPHNATITTPPAANVNHYVALVDGVYHQIPITVPFFELSYLISQKVEAINNYADWYYNTEVTVDGQVFDADDTAKSRLTQANMIYNLSGYLPPFWTTKNNTQYPLTNVNQLTAIILGIAAAFSARYFEIAVLKGQARAATTQEQLDAVIVPQKPLFVM